MSNTDILNMKPGRDLDIKVALTVMDYKWLKHLLQFSAELAVKWLGTSTDLAEAGGVYVIVPDSQFHSLKERENFAEAVLHFSTEMAAAEQVIIRMKELGYKYSLDSKTEEDGIVYYASFHKSEMGSNEKSPGYGTIPEAIVKAALKVINHI